MRFGLALLLTMGLLLALWARLPHDAFFSGDAGIKLMQVEELIANGYTDIRLPYRGQDIDPESVISPFRLEPSLYIKDGSNYAVFPVAFPALSSLGYRACGFAGLYLLPLLAAAVCLGAVYGLARLALPPGAAVLAMVATLLATPVGFYALTFWEHIPSVALVLVGLWLFLRDGAGWATALAAGLLLGAAIWLRTEVALLAGILVATGLLMLRRPRDVVALACGVVLMFAALLLFNHAVYGEWLGHVSLNVRQVGMTVDEDSLTARLSWLRRSLLGLNLPQTVPPGKATGGEIMGMIGEDRAREIVAGLAIGLVLVARVAAAAVVPRRPAWSRRLIDIQLALLVVLGLVSAGYLVAMRGDHSPLLTVLASGGLFTFAPWLAMALLYGQSEGGSTSGARAMTWLLISALVFVILMPVLAPNDGGIRYGPRYLLPAMPLLAIAAVAAVMALGRQLGHRLPWMVAVSLILVAVVVNGRGYEILRHKKLVNRAGAVAMLDNPASRVAVDQWWMIFNSAPLLTSRKVHYVNRPGNVAELVARARRAGEATLIYAMQGRQTRFPFPAERLGVVVERREEVVLGYDGFFDITVFRLRLSPDGP